MRILLRDLSPSTAYAFRLRENAGAAGYSDWSHVFNFTTIGDVLAPSTPQDFTWENKSTSFLAQWSPVTTNSNGTPCNDLLFYLITITSGTTSVEYRVTQTRFDFTLEMNIAAFVTSKNSLSAKVQAVDNFGNRSVASSVIVATNPPPSQPGNFVATGNAESIGLKWDAVPDNDLKEYSLHMSLISGFTPTTVNKVWSGLATATSISSTQYGQQHYFKLAALDVFNTPSTYASANAAPSSSFGVDIDAPSVPTNVAVSSALNASDSSRADFTITWSAVADTDLSGYKIRYRKPSQAYEYVLLDAEVTSHTVRSLDTEVSYAFSVLAYDYSANSSAYSSEISATANNTSPSKPATATLVGDVQSFAVSHNLQKAVGGALESDVVAIEIYVGTTFTWATANPILVETIAINTGTNVAISNKIPYPVTVSNPNRWVYVKAVDSKGLKSTNSDAEPLLVTGLTGTYIQTASITSANINQLEANKITAGLGILNNLQVKSELLLNTNGVIKNKLFVDSGGAEGFSLSSSGLIIKTGSIAARSLEIQNSSNIVPAQYAGFEFVPSFYKVKREASADTSATLVHDGISDASVSVQTATNIVKYEDQSLRIVNNTASIRMLHLSNSMTNYNIVVDAGKEYIVSAWIYWAGSSNKIFGLSVINESSVSDSKDQIVPANVWTRISFVASQSVTGNLIMSVKMPASTIFYLDGVQVEERISASEAPSAWKPPGITKIDGNAIRTGEIRSTTLVSVNGAQQPAWSINMQGKAQFGDANVRGLLLVGNDTGGAVDGDAGGSRVQSANYIADIRGWMIRSDGYAEFRNLAVNSISVTTLDNPLQSTIGSKLYDYMEDAKLWRKITGSVGGSTNDSGAYSASALLNFTGNSSASRDALGVQGGLAFEPEVLYRISVRARQLTGSSTAGEVYKVRMGLVGYKEDGILCDINGGADITKMYFAAADNVNLEVFDGSSTQSDGWTTFVGYVKGRGTSGTSAAAPDPYSPAKVHQDVRFIVPYVQMNIGNSSNVAQLDAFTIETFEAGAPQKIATDFTGRRAVTIESRSDGVFDHGVRFYSGDESELSPGIVGHFIDGNAASSSSLLISPPKENQTAAAYEKDNLVIRSSNANYLYGGDVDDKTISYGWYASGNASLSTVTATSDEGDLNNKAIRLDRVGTTADIRIQFNIDTQLMPELLGEEFFTFSASINPNVAMNVGIGMFIYTNNGGTIIYNNFPLSSLAGNTWTNISSTASIPGGIPDDTNLIQLMIYNPDRTVDSDFILIDKMQFEVGPAQTPFKNASASQTYLDTSSTVINHGLFIVSDNEVAVPTNNAAFMTPLVGQKKDVPVNPFILMNNGTSNLLIGDFVFKDSGGSFRHYSEFAQLSITQGRQGGGLRIYDTSDSVAPGRVELFNAANQPLIYSFNKNGDIASLPTTTDLKIDGYLTIGGEPPWKTINTTAQWTAFGGSYTIGYYVNENKTFMRGIVAKTTGTFTAGTVICTLPVEARPLQQVYLNLVTWPLGNNSGVLLVTVATTGVVAIGNFGAPAIGTYISFDSVWFSRGQDTPYTAPGANTSAPNGPTALSILPYASGTATGTYTLKWTGGSSSDNATTRIVWRSDKSPASATDGNIINVPSATSSAKSYNVTGLPVNKTIYFRLYSIDTGGNVSAGSLAGTRYLLQSPIFVNPTATRSYRDSFGGGWRSDTDDVYQGEYASNDNHRGLWFYGTQISTLLNTGGVARVPTKMAMFLRRRKTAHGAIGKVNINVAAHGHTSQPAGAPSLTATNVLTQLARGDSQSVTLPGVWYGSFTNGVYRGAAISHPGSEYAILDGRTLLVTTGRLTIFHKG